MKKQLFWIIFTLTLFCPFYLFAFRPYEIIGRNSAQDNISPYEIIGEQAGSDRNVHERNISYYYSITEYPINPSLNIYFFEFDDIIFKAAKTFDVDFLLIKSIIMTESNFDPRAESSKGAIGLMQIMPENYGSLGINDPFDPHENIMGGTNYLRQQMDTFGQLDKALAAYNAGPEEVKKNDGIPPFKETINYVARVKQLYEIFTLSEKFSLESKKEKGGNK